MDDILLSNEAYEILKRFAVSSPLSDSDVSAFPKRCLDQLSEHEIRSTL